MAPRVKKSSDKMDPKREETSYRYTDTYLDSQAYERREHLGGYKERMAVRCPPEKDVAGGAWVMITRSIPVEQRFKPMKWGVYWATPCTDSRGNDGYDASGRYKAEVLIRDPNSISDTSQVGIFPHEYLVMSEDLMQGLVHESNGYTLQQIMADPNTGMTLDLIEQGRALTEDERSIIWAFQVDGLLEIHACQEYFLGRHIQTENRLIWYCPTDECIVYMEDNFSWAETFGDPIGNANRERRAAARIRRAQA